MGQARSRQAHSWMCMLHVSTVVPASDRKQGLIWVHKQLQGPWPCLLVCPSVTAHCPPRQAYCSGGRKGVSGQKWEGAKLEFLALSVCTIVWVGREGLGWHLAHTALEALPGCQ